MVVEIREIAIDGKYPDPEGWRTVDPIDYIDAIHRHEMAMRRGELYDRDDGKLHSAHIACTALFLAEIQAGMSALPGNPPYVRNAARVYTCPHCKMPTITAPRNCPVCGREINP
jgi:rubrerythrin